MIEAPQRTKPVLEPWYFCRPHLVDPADLGFAAIFPPLDGIDVKKIPVLLADKHK
jgi:hypothetical protein